MTAPSDPFSPPPADGSAVAGDVVMTGLTYRGDEPVVVRVRQRGRRIDISDDGFAVALAGRPAGWQERAERVVAREGFNVNRRGVVFVPVVQGRDIDSLARRLAGTSRAVYLDLLELACTG